MSRTGPAYWERLDHLRALAAFMVFNWHFLPLVTNHPTTTKSFLPFLEEGHVGVALFMTLSGYLFAKIVDEQTIDAARFLLARLRRLSPMLIVALLGAYAATPSRWVEIPLGLVWPPWENGCWSVAVELQLYLLFPILLNLGRRHPGLLLGVLLLLIAGRSTFFLAIGPIRSLTYYSIFGRLDQFIIGILAWRLVRGRRVPWSIWAPGGFAIAMAIVQFDRMGGFAGTGRSAVWIIWPTIEALGAALVIAAYDGGRVTMPAFLTPIGRLSYSFYLLHTPLVHLAGTLLLTTLGPQEVHVAMVMSLPVFAAFLPLAWLAWRYIEPILVQGSRPYLRRRSPLGAVAGEQSAVV